MTSKHPMWRAVRFNGRYFFLQARTIGEAERKAEVWARKYFKEDDVDFVEAIGQRD